MESEIARPVGFAVFKKLFSRSVPVVGWQDLDDGQGLLAKRWSMLQKRFALQIRYYIRIITAIAKYFALKAGDCIGC